MKSVIATLVVLVSTSAQMGFADCKDVFGQIGAANTKGLSALAKWREVATNLSQSGGSAGTNKAREEYIRDSAKEMTNDVLGLESTPAMELVVDKDAEIDLLFQSPGYGSGQVDKIEVSKLGKAGILKATLLLPVSGHTGAANARKWATTDTYSIKLDGPNTNLTLIDNAKSLDIITLQEIEIPFAKKGDVYRLSYHRSGSAGPGGYIEGRVIELVWDGK